MRKTLLTSLLLGLGLVACGGGSDLENKMKKSRDDMCACTDKTCVDKVQEDYKAWTKEARKGDKPDKGTLEKLEALDQEYKACRRKIRDGADGGGAKEGAEKPAADKPADK
jgi:Tfp pilus assembly protein PilP